VKLKPQENIKLRNQMKNKKRKICPIAGHSIKRQAVKTKGYHY